MKGEKESMRKMGDKWRWRERRRGGLRKKRGK